MVSVSYLFFITSVLAVRAHAGECAEGRTGTCNVALGDHHAHADDDSVAIEMQFQLLQSNSFMKPTDDEDVDAAEVGLELNDEVPSDEQFLTENSVLPGGSKSLVARALKAKIVANQFRLRKQFNRLRNKVEKSIDDDDSYSSLKQTHNNTKLQKLVMETDSGIPGGPQSALVRALKGKIVAHKFKLKQQFQKLRNDYEKGEKQVDAVQNISDEALFSTSTEGLPEVLQELVMDTDEMPGGQKSLVVHALKAKIIAHQYMMKQHCQKLRRFLKQQEEDPLGEENRNASASLVETKKEIPQQLAMKEEYLPGGRQPPIVQAMKGKIFGHHLQEETKFQRERGQLGSEAQAKKGKIFGHRLQEETKFQRERGQLGSEAQAKKGTIFGHHLQEETKFQRERNQHGSVAQAMKSKIFAEHFKEETIFKREKVNLTNEKMDEEFAAQRTRAGNKRFKIEEKQLAGKSNDRKFEVSVAKARIVASEKQHLLDRLHHLKLLEVAPDGKATEGEEEADKKQQLADRIEKLKKKRADRLQDKMEHVPVTERLQSLEEIRDKRLEGLREHMPERHRFSLNLIEGTPKHVAATAHNEDARDEANEKQDLAARIESLKQRRTDRLKMEHLPATERLQSLEEIRDKRLEGLRENMPKRPGTSLALMEGTPKQELVATVDELVPGSPPKALEDKINGHLFKERSEFKEERKEVAGESKDLTAHIESLKEKTAKQVEQKIKNMPVKVPSSLVLTEMQPIDMVQEHRAPAGDARELIAQAMKDRMMAEAVKEKTALTAKKEALQKAMSRTTKDQEAQMLNTKNAAMRHMEHAANSLAKTLALMQVKPEPSSGSEEKAVIAEHEVEELPTGVSITKPIIEAMKSKMFGDAHKEKVKMQSLRETLRQQMQDTAAKLEAKVMKTNDKANQHMKDSFGSLAKAFAMLQEEPVQEELPMEELVASEEERNEYIPRGGYKELLEDAYNKKLQKQVARATYNSYERRLENEGSIKHKMEKFVNITRRHKAKLAYHADQVLENIVKRSAA